MNKLFYSTILFFGLSLSLFSQIKTAKDTLYLDENNVKISKSTFNKKIESAVFFSRTYDIKDVVFKKVSYQYYFGKITPKIREELQVIINSKTNRKIKHNENILIHYFDTLQGYEFQKKRHKSYFKNTKGTHILINNDTINPFKNKILTRKKYKKSQHEYQRKLAKCSLKLEKRENTKVIEMYNIDKGYPLELEKLTWMKDPGVFKENFFINIYENNLLIIKPNGDFFMKKYCIEDDDLFHLLKTDDWSQFKMDWEESIKTNSSTGYGIVKSLYSFCNNKNPHPKHCY